MSAGFYFILLLLYYYTLNRDFSYIYILYILNVKLPKKRKEKVMRDEIELV